MTVTTGSPFLMGTQSQKMTPKAEHCGMGGGHGQCRGIVQPGIPPTPTPPTGWAVV